MPLLDENLPVVVNALRFFDNPGAQRLGKNRELAPQSKFTLLWPGAFVNYFLRIKYDFELSRTDGEYIEMLLQISGSTLFAFMVDENVVEIWSSYGGRVD